MCLRHPARSTSISWPLGARVLCGRKHGRSATLKWWVGHLLQGLEVTFGETALVYDDRGALHLAAEGNSFSEVSPADLKSLPNLPGYTFPESGTYCLMDSLTKNHPAQDPTETMLR